MKGELFESEDRLKELKVLLEGPKEEPVFLHPNMGARYKCEIQSLIGMLGVNEKRQEAILILRKLVNQITASPKAENPKELNIDLYGDLAGILNMATKAKPAISIDDDIIRNIEQITGLNAQNRDSQDADFIDKSTNYAGEESPKLVAGARFERAAFRL